MTEATAVLVGALNGGASGFAGAWVGGLFQLEAKRMQIRIDRLGELYEVIVEYERVVDRIRRSLAHHHPACPRLDIGQVDKLACGRSTRG